MDRECKLMTVVGNPKVGSRTLQVAQEVSGQIAAALTASGVTVSMTAIDLAEHAAVMFEWENAAVDAWVKQATEADLLVVASPTYKATYTGLLKAFVDRFPPNALAGHIAVPLMVAAAPIHGLAVETFLRPLLIEVGASCPTKGVFVLESQLPDLPAVVAKWLEGAALSLGIAAARVAPS
jgi:FMN reductase